MHILCFFLIQSALFCSHFSHPVFFRGIHPPGHIFSFRCACILTKRFCAAGKLEGFPVAEQSPRSFFYFMGNFEEISHEIKKIGISGNRKSRQKCIFSCSILRPKGCIRCAYLRSASSISASINFLMLTFPPYLLLPRI